MYVVLCSCDVAFIYRCFLLFGFFFFSSRRRHTRCALVTGVQTCALPICSPCESNQAEVQISALSSDFLVSISGRAPFLARWVITEEQLILREDQGGERAGLSDAHRRRLVFGRTARLADGWVVTPLSLVGHVIPMRKRSAQLR